jgi:hypothetical protein
MKKNSKQIILLLMAFPLIFMSCGNDVSTQLKKEMQSMKDACPQYQGNGVTMTDVNFYENEKVMEYIASIEGVDSLDATTINLMKQGIVGVFNGEDATLSGFEKFSVKTVLKTYGYKFRYIYTDTEGNKLCEIVISKDDL